MDPTITITSTDAAIIIVHSPFTNKSSVDRMAATAPAVAHRRQIRAANPALPPPANLQHANKWRQPRLKCLQKLSCCSLVPDLLLLHGCRNPSKDLSASLSILYCCIEIYAEQSTWKMCDLYTHISTHLNVYICNEVAVVNDSPLSDKSLLDRMAATAPALASQCEAAF